MYVYVVDSLVIMVLVWHHFLVIFTRLLQCRKSPDLK